MIFISVCIQHSFSETLRYTSDMVIRVCWTVFLSLDSEYNFIAVLGTDTHYMAEQKSFPNKKKTFSILYIHTLLIQNSENYSSNSWTRHIYIYTNHTTLYYMGIPYNGYGYILNDDCITKLETVCSVCKVG